jgi:hypothetical protein
MNASRRGVMSISQILLVDGPGSGFTPLLSSIFMEE